jgi:hypothetical protein
MEIREFSFEDTGSSGEGLPCLDDLLDGRRLWRGSEAHAGTASTIPTGYPDLDATLHGGWPQAGLTEVLTAQEGLGSLSLFMPALARLSRGERWIAWVAPPYIPYAPALAHWGLNVSSILWVHARPRRDTLWALEQALRSGTCAAVLGWLPQVEAVALRRLQLAAEAGESMGLLFRAPQSSVQPSPASLRLSIVPRHEGIEVAVLKQRGGWSSRSLHIHRARLTGQAEETPPAAFGAAGSQQGMGRLQPGHFNG